MSSLTLYTHEVRALLATGSVLRVRALNPQPEAGRYGDGRIIGKVPDQIGDGGYCVWRPKPSVVIPMTHGCAYRIEQYLPHAPGTVVACREKWWHGPQPDRVEYYADMDDDARDAARLYGAVLRSASTMPAWAVRPELRECRVASVEVKRVQEMTAKEIIDMGAVSRSQNVEAYAMVGGNPKCPVSAFDGKVYPDLRSLWAAGWNARNKPGRRWTDNPYVGVERVEM